MSEKNTDYYELLQVHPKAGIEVIKKAYYLLMQQNHPDKGGSEELAKKINEAYSTLTNAEARKKYDYERNVILLEKVKNARKASETQAREVKSKQENIISKNCPVYSSYGALVTDERVGRVLIINSSGQITWEYGKFGSIQANKLKNPKFAVFTNNQNILITDTGNSKIIEVNGKKDTVWEFGTGEAKYSDNTLNNPSACIKLPNNNYLITDTGNKRVIEVNLVGQIVWQYGDLKDIKMFGKSLWGSFFDKNTSLLFNPVFSQRLENGNTLISDTGNKRLIEVNPDKKIVWEYPNKKGDKKEFFEGANFINKMSNGNIFYTLDKYYEMNPDGEVIWFYNKNTIDTDINWAYKVDNNSFLLSLTRIVRRGVNQEIMMIDASGKALWKYYFSQYKHV